MIDAVKTPKAIQRERKREREGGEGERFVAQSRKRI